ncbi:MAG TPA: PPK2 family polyphosphate kinase, partial [Acidimicrobiia bacterium]|nr:PPK2 family polyphosphate kinase [Acidimicrobiia bacterium]
MRHQELRVLPGQTVDLATFPTRSDTAWEGSKQAGKERVKELAKELSDLQKLYYADGSERLLVVLQAMDTGGKDSTIRDVFGRMNPQGVRVTSFKQPTHRELAHDYLWRVHPHVPGDGEITIFNRSHYEDVLVPRARGHQTRSEQQQRLGHIADFERMLSDEGTTIIKCYLHISIDEQRQRLQDRLDDPTKHWKFDYSDIR